MENSAIKDPLFLRAVEAIDAGDISTLQYLLTENTQLINTRLDVPDEGYFKNPYLMWFVADNPIRNNKLPVNIVDITRLLIENAHLNAPDSFQFQIDYTFGLVSTGRVPRDCGVQIELMDLLIDAGVTPAGSIGALAHGNAEAARYLISKGETLTLGVAVGLELLEEFAQLLSNATQTDKQIALMVAAFYGKPDIIKQLIASGVDVNAYLEPSSGFHHHASALHQAVYSGNIEAVKLLLDAGANTHTADKIYGVTPLGWAKYSQTENADKEMIKKYAEIERLFYV